MQSPLSVLIVDDEEELAALYEGFIMGIGYEAISFTDPVLAFEHYKQCAGRYSLIMTDLRMPGMCGIELANKIRKLNSSVKIFLITAFDVADVESQWAIGTAKCDRIIQKPIKLSMLKKAIEQDTIRKPEKT